MDVITHMFCFRNWYDNQQKINTLSSYENDIYDVHIFLYSKEHTAINIFWVFPWVFIEFLGISLELL